MKKKEFTKIIMGLFLLTGLLLVSCKGKRADAKKFKPRLDIETKSQITIVGNYKNFEALEAEFDRFNEIYPNVELSYLYLDNYKATIKSAMASDSAPDIYMTFPWMLDKEDYKDVIDSAENMSDEKALGYNLATIRKQLIARTSDGKVPMVPVLSGSYGMMVNEDIFKKEGLELPDNYREFVEVCKKLKEAGYPSPIMAYVESFMTLPMIYSYFCKSIQNNPQAIEQLNALDKSAGQYLKPTLEWAQSFKEAEIIDYSYCRVLKDKYNSAILRFFEGDVPILLCDTETVSGTLKRESQSEAFVKNPFKYSFRIFPATDKGSDFVNSVVIGFSINKNSDNLAMTNEFMRFLIRTDELNNLAKIKRLITTSTDYSFDEMYTPLSKSNPIYLDELGLVDNATAQMRNAVYKVLRGDMTVDEAVANYGSF